MNASTPGTARIASMFLTASMCSICTMTSVPAFATAKYSSNEVP